MTFSSFGKNVLRVSSSECPHLKKNVLSSFTPITAVALPTARLVVTARSEWCLDGTVYAPNEETLADDLISQNRTDDDTKLRTGCCILPLSEDGSEPSENVLKSKWVKRGV
jgi:hypothetical protein